MLRLSVVILAAGASKRLGYNKLSVRIDGEAVIRRTVRLFAETRIGEITVVTGYEREKVVAELSGLPTAFVHNPRPEDGMSASIRAAIGVISASDLVLFHLGDKPFVSPDTVKRVLEAGEGRDGGIVVPVHGGIKGHPVLIDVRKHLAALAGVKGEGGLREMIAGRGADVLFVEGDEGSILDLDTEDDLTALQRRGHKVEKG
jgi:molybdenum cofactor cytidylyltransferase